MNCTPLRSSFILLLFVVLNVASGQTKVVPFSSLGFIFDTSYLINASLEQFPDSEVLLYDSESYPGVILAGSRIAVLTTLSDVPEAHHRAMLDQVFCQVTSSIVVAYGERHEYEVQLVHIAHSGDVLTFTTQTVHLTAERRGCD